MRILSLIPSITETLFECGAELVGRSRFCVEPRGRIDSIPKLGGTKDIDWESVAAVEPDLVILDKEENTREMAEQCPYPYLALHITSVKEVAPELRRLAGRIVNDKLAALADRWDQVSQQGEKPRTLIELPGMIEWWVPPTERHRRLEYLIWRNPWMGIGPNTFIHSMLQQQGVGRYLKKGREKYPVLDLDSLDPQQTVLLFSSEPYPFQRYRGELQQLGFSCGLIDAEKYSWYGLRSLQFLEETE